MCILDPQVIMIRSLWIILLVHLSSVNSGLSNRTKDDRTKGSEYLTATACEGAILEIRCPQDTHIDIIRANFGRFSIEQCNDNGAVDLKVDCISTKSFRALSHRCATKSQCIILATSDIFGDPCPDTPKYLETQYICKPVTRKLKYSIRNTSPSLFLTNSTNIPTKIPSSTLPSISYSASSTLSSSTQSLTLSSTTGLFLSSPKMIKSPSTTSASTTTTTTTTSTTTTTTTTTTITTAVPSSHDFDYVPENDRINPMYSSSGTWEKPSKWIDFTGPIYVKHPHPRDNLTPSKEEYSDEANDSDSLKCVATFSRGLQWNQTKVDAFVRQPCPRGSKGFAKWYCSNETGEIDWISAVPDLRDCISDWVENLHGMKGVEIFGSTVANYSKDLKKLTEFVKSISEWNDISREVLENVQDGISNMLEDDVRNAWSDLLPAERVKLIKELMIGLNRILNKVVLIERNSNQVYVSNVDKSYVVIPSEQKFIDDLSDELSGGFIETWSNSLSLVVSIFKKLDIILGWSNSKRIINSDVMSISLKKELNLVNKEKSFASDEEETTEMIGSRLLIIFTHKKKNLSKASCANWDMEWRNELCTLIETNWTHSKCDCKLYQGFGVFALIGAINEKLPYEKDGMQEAIMKILAYLSCIITILCMACTLMTLFLFKKRKSPDGFHQFHQCVCLLIFQILLICLLSSSSSSTKQISSHLQSSSSLSTTLPFSASKSSISYMPHLQSYLSPQSHLMLLLHYLVLTILTWLIFESLEKSYPFTLNGWDWLVAYFLPLCVIIVSNQWSKVIVEILGIMGMCTLLGLSCKKRGIRTWCHKCFALLGFIGCSWEFSFHYLTQQLLLFGGLFAVTNIALGIMVFMFYSWSQEAIRDAYLGAVRGWSSHDSSKEWPKMASENIAHYADPIIPIGGMRSVLERNNVGGSRIHVSHLRGINGHVNKCVSDERIGPRGPVCVESSVYPAAGGLIVEHVYECIDDEPYTAKVFVPTDERRRAKLPLACGTATRQGYKEKCINEFKRAKINSIYNESNNSGNGLSLGRVQESELTINGIAKNDLSSNKSPYVFQNPRQGNYTMGCSNLPVDGIATNRLPAIVRDNTMIKALIYSMKTYDSGIYGDSRNNNSNN